MVTAPNSLPDDVDALKAALHTATTRALRVEAELAIARAKASDDKAIIAYQKLRFCCNDGS